LLRRHRLCIQVLKVWFGCPRTKHCFIWEIAWVWS
jgi:hypothetical protein